MSPKGLSSVKYVPISSHTKKSPFASPEDMEDKLLPRKTALNPGKNATLTPPDEEIQEEEVKCY